MRMIAVAIKRIFGMLTFIKYKIIYGSKFQYGKNCIVFPSFKVRIRGEGKVIIGDECILREYVILNAGDGGIIQIGDRSFLNDGCFLNARECISIGEDALIGQGVKIYDHDHDFRSEDRKEKYLTKKVRIENNVWFGSNVVILRGVTIGENSVVGAGSLIKKSIGKNKICYSRTEQIVKDIT